MSPSDWLPAITSSSVLGVLGIAAGMIFKARIERGAQFSFDRKLEELRGKLRKDEEEFRAAILRGNEQLAALRVGALSALSARQAGLDKRRAEAVERVWAETVELARFKVLAHMVSSLKMDALMDRASGNSSDAPKIRDLAENILKSNGFSDPASFRSSNIADKERPFLDPIAWAMFTAYRQMVLYPAMLMSLVRGGIEKDALGDTGKLLEPLKSALPEYSDYIDTSGLYGLAPLIQPLEEKLLAALIESLAGRELDQAAITQAASIIEGVDKATAAMSAALKPSDPQA